MYHREEDRHYPAPYVFQIYLKMIKEKTVLCTVLNFPWWGASRNLLNLKNSKTCKTGYQDDNPQEKMSTKLKFCYKKNTSSFQVQLLI